MKIHDNRLPTSSSTNTRLAIGAICALLVYASPVFGQSVEEARKVPGALPTLPISAGKKLFNNAFIAEARKYWRNFQKFQDEVEDRPVKWTM